VDPDQEQWLWSRLNRSETPSKLFLPQYKDDTDQIYQVFAQQIEGLCRKRLKMKNWFMFEKKTGM
jgi:hypothetical protein